MRIEWATLCKFAETSNMGTTIVDFGQGAVIVRQLPTLAQIHCAMCLTDMLDLPAIDTVNIRVLKPSGERTAEFNLNIAVEIASPADMPSDIAARQGYSCVLPFKIDELGTYVVELSLPDQEPIRLSLVARQ